MNTVSVDAVLFDLDGTLIDHQSAASAAVTATFLGDPEQPVLDQDLLTRRWLALEATTLDRYLAGEWTFIGQRRLRITCLAEELGLGCWTTAQADAWFARYLQHYEQAWRTYPDVDPALASLTVEHPWLRLGVITNGDADQQRRKLQHVGLASALPYVTISSEVGAAKPDGRIFAAACDQLGVDPSRVAYIGDRLHTDAEAAALAGMRGVWLDRERIGAVTPVPRVTTLTELQPLLAGPTGHSNEGQPRGVPISRGSRSGDRPRPR
ncbi:HAD family hydrolase [Nocardia abscessus]|uniref:HAD family hydrolase n=1 Tax=Nocardia abscessus TaxID=120957 RepID=UPI002456ABA1|nr:HAD family hydrolase [Nocardia abscessus]